jgi:two-component system sensor kinase FixL
LSFAPRYATLQMRPIRPMRWREAMMRADAEGRRLRARLRTVAAMALALAIFALDVLTPLQGAVAVLYITVVLIAARGGDRALVNVAGAVCALLAVTGYGLSHWGEPLDSAAMRLAVSLTAIAIATWLSVRNLAAAEESRHSEIRYRSIFDAAGFPIWESDWSAAYAMLRAGREPEPALVSEVSADMRLRDANDAAVRLFGQADRAALIGESIRKHYNQAGVEALARILAALFRGERSVEMETQFLTGAGETIDVVLRVTLPPDDDGWKRVLIMALDVTERNRAQARFAQAQAELTHVARVTTLGQLAASIAHEVNQPLSAIITYAKSGKRWLAREAAEAHEVSDCLDHIASNGTRAAEVIARVRNLATKADPTYGRIELAPLIEETVSLLHRDLQSNQVDIRLSIVEDVAVTGDAVQVQQVLMNLLLNAEQAMAGMAEGREIWLDVACEGDAARVAVRDGGTGVGDDPERLFQPFFTTRREGMGMGLSICRSIIEQHGGTLTAANHPEGGAVFRFTLPLVAAERAAA